jgi:hypothetical protein
MECSHSRSPRAPSFSPHATIRSASSGSGRPEDRAIELDYSYRIAIDDGESVPGGIEGHGRWLRISFEAPHYTGILKTRVQFGPHMEHLPSRKLDQLQMAIEGKNVASADGQGRAGRLVELERAKASPARPRSARRHLGSVRQIARQGREIGAVELLEQRRGKLGLLRKDGSRGITAISKLIAFSQILSAS